MEIKIYDTKEMQNHPELIDFMLDTIINNLTYIYGPYMDNEENRQIWANNNIYETSDHNRFLFAFKGEPIGFIIYNINDDKVLTFKDIELDKDRTSSHPLVIFSLFKKIADLEGDNFNCVQGYINKKNELSIRNFMRFASYKIEKEKGYYIVVDKETTENLKKRFASHS